MRRVIYRVTNLTNETYAMANDANGICSLINS